METKPRLDYTIPRAALQIEGRDTRRAARRWAGDVGVGLLCAAVVPRAGAFDIKVGFGPGESMSAGDALNAAGAIKAPDVPKMFAGYVVGKPAKPVEWVPIAGGKFTMGTDDGYGDDKPIHAVTVEAFSMAKTAVTVEQYAECVSRMRCTAPDTGGSCNWGKAGREDHPVHCVNWEQANQFAKFAGARLPSESAWEFAATSRGKNRKYPWGNEEPTCERAVVCDGNDGCGGGGTTPVCSKPKGSTEQGLCDMSGNVWQWTQDWYHNSYVGAPTNGSAWESPAGSCRVIRGGSFSRRDNAWYLRSDFRASAVPGYRLDAVGFRPVRDSRR